MTDDATLREAYRELMAAREPRDPSACPAPEALLAVVERKGDDATRLATLDHVMGCAACRRDFDLLRTAAVSAEESAASGKPSRHVTRGSGSPVRRFPLRSIAVAAGLVVAVGVGMLTWHPGTRQPLLRGDANTIVLLAPEQRPDGSALLRWHTVPGAVAYRVEVFAPTGRTVVADTVNDSTFVLPATADAVNGEQLLPAARDCDCLSPRAASVDGDRAPRRRTRSPFARGARRAVGQNGGRMEAIRFSFCPVPILSPG